MARYRALVMKDGYPQEAAADDIVEVHTFNAVEAVNIGDQPVASLDLGGDAQISAEVVQGASLAVEIAPAVQTQSGSHDTEGTTAANTMRVSIQINDAAGAAQAMKCLTRWWISDAAGSVTLTSQSPTVAYVDGTELTQRTANKDADALSDATGKLTLDVTVSGAHTVYLNYVIAGLVHSITLTFA